MLERDHEVFSGTQSFTLSFRGCHSSSPLSSTSSSLTSNYIHISGLNFWLHGTLKTFLIIGKFAVMYLVFMIFI